MQTLTQLEQLPAQPLLKAEDELWQAVANGRVQNPQTLEFWVHKHPEKAQLRTTKTYAIVRKLL